MTLYTGIFHQKLETLSTFSTCTSSITFSPSYVPSFRYHVVCMAHDFRRILCRRLSDNSLTGSIPSELGSLGNNLRYLYVLVRSVTPPTYMRMSSLFTSY